MTTLEIAQLKLECLKIAADFSQSKEQLVKNAEALFDFLIKGYNAPSQPLFEGGD